MKYPEPYLIDKSRYYYFAFQPHTGKRKVRSTKKKTKREAREVIKAFMDRLNSEESSLLLKDYAAPFFTEHCPHVTRFRDTGKSIGSTHINKSRYWLEEFILKDPIAKRPISLIRRGDVLDFRRRIVARGIKEKPGYGPNTVNKVTQTLKTILSEAFFRQDISMNPGAEIGHLDYKQTQKTVLSVNQIQKVIHTPYENFFKTFLLFLVYTGCRVGEVRALRWENVSNNGDIAMIEAVKGKEIGPPKWNRTRNIAAPKPLLSALKSLQKINKYVFPSLRTGEFAGETWARKNHIKFLKIAELPDTITPHSYRHTLNSHLLASGLSPVLVQAWLGWSNNSLTPVQRGYTHPELLDMRKVAREIEQIYSVDDKKHYTCV